MAVLVQSVVSELHLEKRQRLLHPMTSWGRRIRVHVCPTWGLGLCLPRDLPLLLFPLQRNGGGKDAWLPSVIPGDCLIKSLWSMRCVYLFSFFYSTT